ncbi:hypothetical protein WJX74_006096 [Apatococcus lobatus]|uniref:2Fe-2S ferredoxin-type domain-containing protein n=2 Tax=Apatococcus TaxID=904362 RepID=A0AAW1RWC9_9CHLO
MHSQAPCGKACFGNSCLSIGRNNRRVCASAARELQKSRERQKQPAKQQKQERKGGLGDVLGPIGLTLGGELDKAHVERLSSNEGVSSSESGDENEAAAPRSISAVNTADWRAQHEAGGVVDLWVEEEFNSGSRLMGGRGVHQGSTYGTGSGEGRSQGNVAHHSVRIRNHHAGQTVDVQVPEDRYVLWEAEERGLLLPWACRMGCCTACAVRILEGSMYQPEALGVSQELKERGFALMCVGYPRSDLVLETVAEDEVYDLQFGESFASQATNPGKRQNISRDDFALEIANMDE